MYDNANEKFVREALSEADAVAYGNETALMRELNQIDFDILKEQRKVLSNGNTKQPIKAKPYTDYVLAGNVGLQEYGTRLVELGKVGCIIMAGGQGTRLGFNGPKGMIPVTNVKDKSLFQVFAGKTLAASRKAGVDLPLAIMTSPLNHEQTENFFKENDFWGLKPQQVSFFQQDVLPFLNEQGQLFLDRSKHIAVGPNGNGCVFKCFYQSGIWNEWREKGVEYVNIVQVDNPLADPFDVEMIGYASQNNLQLVLKGVLRDDPGEKVGFVASIDGDMRILEYSEFETESSDYQDYSVANTGMFCLSIEFVKYCSNNYYRMPYHMAWKKADHMGEDCMAWKFEKFIFDVLYFTSSVGCLVYHRQDCFAPLKNKEGKDSVESVKKALLAKDKAILEEITGISLSFSNIELSEQFYYPDDAMLKIWKGKIPKDEYVL